MWAKFQRYLAWQSANPGRDSRDYESLNALVGAEVEERPRTFPVNGRVVTYANGTEVLVQLRAAENGNQVLRLRLRHRSGPVKEFLALTGSPQDLTALAAAETCAPADDLKE